MCRLGKKNKRTKTIIIEDGVVNPNKMCLITIPRNKESVVLYARKREMAGPNVDRTKPPKIFNAMEELLHERSDRQFNGVLKRPKVVPRPERYDNFRKALEKNIKRTEKTAKINSTISHATDGTPSRYENNRSKISKNASFSFMPSGCSTLNDSSRADDPFKPLLASTMNSTRAEASFEPSMRDSMRAEGSSGPPSTRTMASPIEEDDYEDHQAFQPDYSNYPQTYSSPPPWQFHSNNSYSPGKTYTIMPPDNRHFQQTKSSDFDESPRLVPSSHSYEDDYSDIIGIDSNYDGNYEGSRCTSQPPDNKNYYSLIEEFQNCSANSSICNRDSRTRQSNSFAREHELINIYNDQLE